MKLPFSFVAALIAAQAFASVPSFLVQNSDTPIEVDTAAVLVDSASTIDFPRAKASREWRLVRGLNFGYNSARHWFQFKVFNPTESKKTWVLELGYPLIQRVTLFEESQGKALKKTSTGKLFPFEERPIKHRNFLFPFELAAKETTTFYLVLETVGALRAPLQIYGRDAFIKATVRQSLGFGIYYGAILALVLYNLFVFLSLRDRNFLFYVLYASSFALLQATLSGVAYQYLWPEAPWMNNRMVPILVGFSFFFLVLFTRNFLDTPKHAPRTNRMLMVLSGVSIFLFVLGIGWYGIAANQLSSAMVTVAPLLVLPAAVICWRRRVPAAGYYLLAFVCFFAGSSAVAAKDLGIISLNFVTVYGMHLGSCLEALLFSIGLANRMRVLTEDKRKLEFSSWHAKQKLLEQEGELKRQRSVAELASQTAHDIRSPVAALKMAIEDLSPLKESQRKLLRSAVTRIVDIANNLLSTHVPLSISDTIPYLGDSGEARLLVAAVDSIMSEKRAEFRSKGNVSFCFPMPLNAHAIFVSMPPQLLKRVLSNVINNSVEAIADHGEVRVEISCDGLYATIRVIDDGKGIPSSVLPKLMTRGFSHEKPGGSGLGLYGAKEGIERCGGRIALDSKEGVGTTVSIRVPQVAPPSCFAMAIEISSETVVAILDDDDSIHVIWEERLRGRRKTEHFTQAVDFERWLVDAPRERLLCLLDLELLGQGVSGLDIIERQGIAAASILVTGRFEEREVTERCIRSGVRLVPKELVSIVPIHMLGVHEGAGSQIVLIDDDQGTHLSWHLSAEIKRIRLRTFNSFESFSEVEMQFPLATPVYIDSDLGEGVQGEDVARDLWSKGFQNVFIATGRASTAFQRMWWLKEIRGKEPPWDL